MTDLEKSYIRKLTWKAAYSIIATVIMATSGSIYWATTRYDNIVYNQESNAQDIKTGRDWLIKLESKQEVDKAMLSNHETRISNTEIRLNYLAERPQPKRYYSRR